MSKRKNNPSYIPQTKKAAMPRNSNQNNAPVKSLLDIMKDGKEFGSLINVRNIDLDLVSEIRRSLREISESTKRAIICYAANIVRISLNLPISINLEDDLPFTEMIESIPRTIKEIDIILVTPGGDAQQVAKFVDKLRPRFDSVNFILPNMAMSAGTIFAMSGNKIYMGPNSYLGPIDPQVQSRGGNFLPAQAILTLIEDIRLKGEEAIKKGQQPSWADLQILNSIDPKEIGNAMSASRYSMELVEKYLQTYKFSNLGISNSENKQESENKKLEHAKKIAAYLCDHSQLKTHSRGITREELWKECELRTEYFENTPGLERAVRRFWGLFCWICERTPLVKLFLSDTYCIIRNEPTISL